MVKQKEGNYPISREQLIRLNQAQVQKWVKLFLADSNNVIRNRGESPSGLMFDMYQNFPETVQENFRMLFLLLLQKTVETSGETLRPTTIEELLLATNYIFSSRGEDQEKANVRKAVFKMYQQDRFKIHSYPISQDDDCTNHWRAAQTLVALGHQAPISFWSDMVRSHGETYANVAFSGMWRNDFDGAIQWLRKNIHQERAMESFIIGLPLIAERLGKQKAIEAIDAVMTEKISTDEREDLLKIKALIKDFNKKN